MQLTIHTNAVTDSVIIDGRCYDRSTMDGRAKAKLRAAAVQQFREEAT